MYSEYIPFNPRFRLATYSDVFNGKIYQSEPTARLTFPNIESALLFINTGSGDSVAGNRHNLMTLDYLLDVKEAPVGPENQYDAFIQPNRETGEVNMTVRHYGPHSQEWHGKLSDFVMGIVEKMSEVRAQDAI